MKKILRIVEIILIALGVIAVLYWLISSGDDKVDFMLYVAYAYVGIAILLAIVMTAMNIGKSRNTSKIGMFVGAGCVVLAIIFYFALASSQTYIDAGGNVYDDVFTLKATDTMLYLAYATGIGAIVFLLAGEIRNAIK